MKQKNLKRYFSIGFSVLAGVVLLFGAVALFTPRDKAKASDGIEQSLNSIEKILDSLSEKDFDNSNLEDGELGLVSKNNSKSSQTADKANTATASSQTSSLTANGGKSSSSEKNSLEYAIVENEVNNLLAGLDNQFDNSTISDGSLGI